ncbi:MAG: PilZ domain-containing protein, partial [Francisellaceae bacterium]|nr:PilZ domain-containing protein [Francisellaceae bacterium]
KKIQYLIHTTNKHADKYKFAFVNISSKGLIVEIERAINIDDDFEIYLFFLNTFDSLKLNAKVNNTVNLNNKIYASASFTELSEADEDRIIKNVFESERRSLQADKI